MKQKATLLFRSYSLSFLILLITVSLSMQSCYLGEDLTPEETDIVATFFDQNADFATKRTYALPDTVVRLDDENRPIIDPGPYDQQLLDLIRTNMNNMGYTETTPANADVLVIALVTTTKWVSSGGCYYDWWYGWWYPYYGWCYPVVYTYDTGSILIGMLDAKATDAKTGLWVAGINGVLGGSNPAARVTERVNQAFEQSQYLGEGK